MAREDESAVSNLGAYGLRLTGAVAPRLLVPAESDWPHLKISAAAGGDGAVTEEILPDRARLRLRTGGSITLDRQRETAHFTVPRLLGGDELAHPYLAPAAAIVAHWNGRESFHAGAFAVGSGIWALVAESRSGKSSTLAWLAQRGHAIVADDLMVLDSRGRVFAGPRSIMLREDAPRGLGVSESVEADGMGRTRFRLPDAPDRLPLRGWVFLTWGDEIELKPVRASERLPRLAPQRGVRLPPGDPTTLLGLASLPCWELRRPRDWGSLRSSVDVLLSALAA